MTGLLPIKNMARNQFLTDFYEYTMVQPEPLENILEAVKRKRLDTYWTQTETCEPLKSYINGNWNHLREDIIFMPAENRCKISTRKFQNDMVNIKGKDDVLTLLVHLWRGHPPFLYL